MSFAVNISRTAERASLEVVGELDIATVPELESALDGIAAGAAVTIDLGATEFIDSTACRLLVTVARARGADVEIVCPDSNTNVWRVLDLLGLIDILGVRQSPGGP